MSRGSSSSSSGYPWGDEPWWVSREEEPAEPPPLTAVPCPCCTSAGASSHEHHCETALDLQMARLSALLGRPLPEGWLVGQLSFEDPYAEEPTLRCQRCFDSGVVPADREGFAE